MHTTGLRDVFTIFVPRGECIFFFQIRIPFSSEAVELLPQSLHTQDEMNELLGITSFPKRNL